MAPTLDDPNGLVNLRNLAQEVKIDLTGNQDLPIVFVPGFSGWGAPLFGAINYFGGVIDLPKLLVDEGYTVIVAPVAPISTNWERACELFIVTRLLEIMGYHLVLPKPGAYIPRSHVMLALLPLVYAMGGQKLTAPQMEILGPNPGDWNLNDGIVNTESMSGPKDCVKSVASLPDLDFGNDKKKGVYWHLGVNDQVDYADEIGVFIELDTGDLMQEMYLNIASLISRLPFDNSGSN